MKLNKDEIELVEWCLERLQNNGSISDERQDQILELLAKVHSYSDSERERPLKLNS